MESWWPSPDYEYRFQYTLEQTHVKAFFSTLAKKDGRRCGRRPSTEQSVFKIPLYSFPRTIKKQVKSSFSENFTCRIPLRTVWFS
jgi:hypothetical protein